MKPALRAQSRACFAIALLLPLAAAARQPPPSGDLIGAPTHLTAHGDDTLLDVALAHDVGYVAIRNANPAVDPWLPGQGTAVRVPTQHLLPPAPRRGIVINLPEMRLYYFPAHGGPVRSFPIGIGDEGKATPVGYTRVVRKRANPTWTPTPSEHAENPDLPRVVKAGPDNPMGLFALYLGWPGYAIHGTNIAYSIGRRDSHGCIRLYPDDIATLFKIVPVGTRVTVINEPVKAGWAGGEFYVEVHPDESDINAIETDSKRPPIKPIDADLLITQAAGDAAGRLDWNAIHAAEAARTGVPVPVLLPEPEAVAGPVGTRAP